MSFTTEEEKISYALGLSIGGSLKQSGVESINGELFSEAVKNVLAGAETKMTPDEANGMLQEFFGAKQKEAEETMTKVGQAYLAKNKLSEGVVELPSGLQYRIITEGDGPKPTEDQQVKCHYHGSLINGTVFDSSVDRGEPAVFPVGGVIPGWVEALQLMAVGSKWELFIPSNLAYGAQGAGGQIGPHETLIFEVELLEIVK